ncbi:MAG: hypothetical protein EBY09_14915 [Verrucomicrobia bacterium]|nr:hypothetical protein [Verrucomicrobiota bacterium]
MGDENRKVAFDMGVPVSTSDWIDAWLKASQGQSIETLRETLTELFTLHHRHVDRITERRVKHELAQTEQAIEDRVRREVEAERIKAQLEAESQQEGV